MIRHLNPEGAPPTPLFSHAVEVASPQKLLFVSGQIGVAADGSVPEDIGGQTTAVVANLKAALATAGLGIEDIVKSTVYLTDESLFNEFAAAAGAAGLIVHPPAANTLVYVKALIAPVFLVEIEAIAAK